MIRVSLTRNRKTLLVVAVLAIAIAACVISWRVGSPLMTTVRTTDVELELKNLLGPSTTPVYKVP